MFKSFVTSSFSTVPKKTNSGHVCQTGQHYEIHHHWCSHTWLDRLAHAAWASWGFVNKEHWLSLKVATGRPDSPCEPSSKEPSQPPVRKEWGQACEQAEKETPREKNSWMREHAHTHTHNTEKDRARNFWFWGTVRKLNSHFWAATYSQFQTGVGCNSLGSRRQAHSFHWSIDASLVSLTTKSTEMRK